MCGTRWKSRCAVSRPTASSRFKLRPVGPGSFWILLGDVSRGFACDQLCATANFSGTIRNRLIDHSTASPPRQGFAPLKRRKTLSLIGTRLGLISITIMQTSAQSDRHENQADAGSDNGERAPILYRDEKKGMPDASDASHAGLDVDHHHRRRMIAEQAPADVEDARYAKRERERPHMRPEEVWRRSAGIKPLGGPHDHAKRNKLNERNSPPFTPVYPDHPGSLYLRIVIFESSRRADLQAPWRAGGSIVITSAVHIYARSNATTHRLHVFAGCSYDGQHSFFMWKISSSRAQRS